MTTATRVEIKDLKAEILAVIERHAGRANPIKASELAVMFGYSTKNTWAIREPIGELIKEGHPIIAALTPPEGYFMAENYKEVNEYRESLKQRGIKDIIRRRDIKRAADNHFSGQGKFVL